MFFWQLNEMVKSVIYLLPPSVELSLRNSSKSRPSDVEEFPINISVKTTSKSQFKKSSSFYYSSYDCLFGKMLHESSSLPEMVLSLSTPSITSTNIK